MSKIEIFEDEYPDNSSDINALYENDSLADEYVRQVFKSIPGKADSVMYDSGKSRLDLVEPSWMLGIGDVLRMGSEKYRDGNWKGLESKRIYAAVQRHLLSYWSGNKLDDESGMSHLLHASARLMMLYYLEENNND